MAAHLLFYQNQNTRLIICLDPTLIGPFVIAKVLLNVTFESEL